MGEGLPVALRLVPGGYVSCTKLLSLLGSSIQCLQRSKPALEEADKSLVLRYLLA